jgi:hypothetical protein
VRAYVQLQLSGGFPSHISKTPNLRPKILDFLLFRGYPIPFLERPLFSQISGSAIASSMDYVLKCFLKTAKCLKSIAHFSETNNLYYEQTNKWFTGA